MVLTDTITPRQMGLISASVNFIGAVYFSLVCSKRDEANPMTTFTFLGLSLGTILTSSGTFYGGTFLTRIEGIGYIVFALVGLVLWYWTAIFHIGDVPPVIDRLLPDDIVDGNHKATVTETPNEDPRSDDIVDEGYE